MPRNEINYQNTIIYKIVCNDLNVNDLYVGSTTEFTKRKYKHKFNCLNSKIDNCKFKVYDFIRDHGNWDNWSMIEVEKYPCNDGNEARSRERYWIETLKATLNERTPIKDKLPKKPKYHSGPCIYKYPEYYNYCKKYTMDDVVKQNEEYYKKRNKLD